MLPSIVCGVHEARGLPAVSGGVPAPRCVAMRIIVIIVLRLALYYLYQVCIYTRIYQVNSSIYTGPVRYYILYTRYGMEYRVAR